MIPAEPPEGQDKLRAGEVDIALLIEVPWGECNVDTTLERTHAARRPDVRLPAARPPARGQGAAAPRGPARRVVAARHRRRRARTRRSSCARASARASSRKIAFNSDDYAAIQGFVAAGHGRVADPRAGADRACARTSSSGRWRRARRCGGSWRRRWPAATARRRRRRCSTSSSRSARSTPAGTGELVAV